MIMKTNCSEIADVTYVISSDEEESPPAKKPKTEGDSKILATLLDNFKTQKDIPNTLNVNGNFELILIKKTSTPKCQNNENKCNSSNGIKSNNECLIISDEELSKSDDEEQSKTNDNEAPEINERNPDESLEIIDENDEASTQNTESTTYSAESVKEEENNVDKVKEQAEAASSSSSAPTYMSTFLDVCATSVRNSQYESRLSPRFPKMRTYFDSCVEIHNDPNFIKTVRENTAQARNSAAEAVVAFQVVYSYLMDVIKGGSVELSENDKKKARKIEKFIKRLVRRLNELHDAEVDFDDEENSSFIQYDRFCAKLNQAWARYCKIINRNPNSGRMLYERVPFVSSKHNEINRAITKAIKLNAFPSYYEVEKIVKKCAKKHNLLVSDMEIKIESKMCFEKLGNLLQIRRKKALYESHRDYIVANEDPAKKDAQLNETLVKSGLLGQEKMRQIMAKYVNLQENNVQPELSDEDSDNSNHQSESSDDDADSD